MDSDRALASVVVSFRNEAAVIPELLARLDRVFASLAIDHELIFVNDASTDASLQLLTERAAANRRLKIVTMSRQFGPSECAMAGLAFARGDAVVLMDADLQDPPEVIPELLDRWRKGADVVYTVRTRRRGESPLKSLATAVAYRIVRGLADIDVPVDAGDFRLMSRRVVSELLKLPERTPYMRGLVAWVGFKQVPVYYERQPRFGGHSHFPFLSANPWRTFLSGATSFSMAPLVVLLPLGGAIFAASAIAAAVVWMKGARGVEVGIGIWMMVGVGLLGGLQIAALGAIGVYLARVYADVRGRPRFIIESVVGVEEPR